MFVPRWRLSDEAWNLGDNKYLTGIGVQRNNGGQLMVVLWPEDAGDSPLTSGTFFG